jgi:sugar phosphate isomerase/epimerase
MANLPIGLQLYSVREDCARDLPGVLKAVAKMGYAGVEFAGYHGYGAQDLRRMLDDAGLVCCGTHASLDSLLGDALPATIAFNQALGNPYLVVPGLAEKYRDSAAAWRETAALFDRLAGQVAPHGMRVGYHNHFHEFQPMDGQLPFDIFFGGTRADVIMQVDNGNAMHGGGDPIAALRRYPGRAITVHLKEYASGYDKALIGEGDVDWKTTFELCETIGGTQWYIVEQESHAYPPMECVERCLRNLRAMGK